MLRNTIPLAMTIALTACGGGSDTPTPEEITQIIQDITSNTDASFSGDVSAEITKDSASISKTLTIVDPDTGEALFTAQSDVPTEYGSFSLSSDGTWQYTINAENSAVMALSSANENITDQINVTSVDGTTVTLSITILGIDEVENTAASIAGDKVADVSKSETEAITGSLTITDIDTDEDYFVAQNNIATDYGTFSIDENGTWSYRLNTANSEVSSLADWTNLTDTISVTSVDGTTVNVVITIEGGIGDPKPTNTPATFSGENVSNASTQPSEYITGLYTVVDPDDGEALFKEIPANSPTTYGYFSINKSGAWSYIANDSNEVVAALTTRDDALVDTVPVASADGTESTLTFNISSTKTYVYDPGEQVAQISDTSTTDTGELRYKFSEGMTTGKASLALFYEIGQTNTAVVNLYDINNSGDTVIAQLRFDEGEIKLLNGLTVDDYIDVTTFTPGKWVEIELSWDTSNTENAGSYSLVIDGTSYGNYTSFNPSPGVEVTALSIKLASALKVSSHELYVDGLTVYSDNEGDEASEVFTDDFESNYAIGTSLDFDINNLSPYNHNSSEVVIVESPEVSIDPYEIPAERGQYASIADTQTTDNGEIRFSIQNAMGFGSSTELMEQGRLRVSFLKQSDSIANDSQDKNAYITLYGSGGSNAHALIDLRIHGAFPWSDDKENGTLEVRNSDALFLGDMVTIPDEWDFHNSYRPFAHKEGVKFSLDEWHVLEITWDSSSDDNRTQLSITLDGVPYATNFDSPAFDNGGDPLDSDGVSKIAFRFAESSTTVADKTFLVDDIRIHDNELGTGNPVFSESFESYKLEHEVDDSTTPDGITYYHQATTDVIVTEDSE